MDAVLHVPKTDNSGTVKTTETPKPKGMARHAPLCGRSDQQSGKPRGRQDLGKE